MSNRLDTSTTSSSNGFPPKQGTWDFLQDAWLESVKWGNVGRFGSAWDSSVAYAIFGCVGVVVAGNTVFQEGAIFYNGEIYYSPAQSIPNPTGSDVLLFGLDTTQYTTNADPVQYSGGGAPVNCHNQVRIKFSSGTSGTGGIGDYTSILFQGLMQTPSYSGAYIDDLSNPIRYEINGKYVTIKGVLNNTSPSFSSASETIFTLPVLFRPAQLRRFVVPMVTATPYYSICDVESGGAVKMRGDKVPFDTAGNYLDLMFPIS